MLNQTVKRELQVAFSKKAQSPWFRVLKYTLVIGLIYLLWNSNLLWVVLPVLIVICVGLHFWYRFKTNGWTKSYGLWKYEAPGTPEIELLPNKTNNIL
jgi:hypothetical protein